MTRKVGCTNMFLRYLEGVKAYCQCLELELNKCILRNIDFDETKINHNTKISQCKCRYSRDGKKKKFKVKFDKKIDIDEIVENR